MDLGFRNMAGCPLNVYYQQPDTCQESFKFHLGTNGYASDFHWDWESPTKFESTKIGHTFVFRSPVDNSLVDMFTLLPTQIVDCPNMKQTVALPVPMNGDISINIGKTLPDSDTTNNTTALNATNNTTADATEEAGARRGNSNNQFSFDSAFFGSAAGGASF